MSAASPRLLLLFRETSNYTVGNALLERAATVVGCHGKKPPPHWPHPVYSHRVHEEVARDLQAGKYDLVLAFSEHEYRWRHDAGVLRNAFTHVKKSLRTPNCFGIERLTRVAAEARVPIVVYEDDDCQELGIKNWPLLDRCTVLFKLCVPANTFHCFLYQNRRTESVWNLFPKPIFTEWGRKIEPICSGFEVPEYAEECLAPEKKTDVFFSGGVDYSVPRREGLEILLKLRDEGVKVDIPEERLDHRGFLRRMSEAWMTLAPEGASPNSFRFYEAPMVKTVPLINHIGHRRHHPHRDGEHCLYYHVEGDDLAHKIRWALKHKDRLREIADKGHDFVLAHHQGHQLADHMIERGLELARQAKAKKTA